MSEKNCPKGYVPTTLTRRQARKTSDPDMVRSSSFHTTNDGLEQTDNDSPPPLPARNRTRSVFVRKHTSSEESDNTYPPTTTPYRADTCESESSITNNSKKEKENMNESMNEKESEKENENECDQTDPNNTATVINVKHRLRFSPNLTLPVFTAQCYYTPKVVMKNRLKVVKEMNKFKEMRIYEIEKENGNYEKKRKKFLLSQKKDTEKSISDFKKGYLNDLKAARKKAKVPLSNDEIEIETAKKMKEIVDENEIREEQFERQLESEIKSSHLNYLRQLHKLYVEALRKHFEFELSQLFLQSEAFVLTLTRSQIAEEKEIMKTASVGLKVERTIRKKEGLFLSEQEQQQLLLNSQTRQQELYRAEKQQSEMVCERIRMALASEHEAFIEMVNIFFANEQENVDAPQE